MRTGDVFVINLDKWLPDFNTHFTNQEIFPSSLVLNCSQWQMEENYMRIVREEENFDLLGNRKCYYMHEKF
jgi:hypothetical protein